MHKIQMVGAGRTLSRVLMRASLVIAILLGATGLKAGTVTATFDITVSSRYLYAQNLYDPSFVPMDILISATFDTDVAYRVQYPPTEGEVWFGTPRISSPLTATLPSPTTTNPPWQPTLLYPYVMMDYQYSGSGTSYSFKIHDDQDYLYEPDTAQGFTYEFNIETPYAVASSIPDQSNFSGSDLMAWLQSIQGQPSTVSYLEYSAQYDSDLDTQEGISYMGYGSLVSVSTPEPSTSALLGAGLLMLFAGVRIARHSRSLPRP
jgi:hypothetical protein